MKCLNFGSEEAPKWYFATTILINGEELEIIPAFTDYSLKHKNFEKDKVFKAIDKSKLLPTVFCFCDAKPFYAENVPLYDYVGSKIGNLPDNAPAVMVYLDKADNVNLLGLTDEPLQAELVECDSVSDAYRRVATTAYLSQCPSKDEWIGYAGIVTGDELLLNIRKFGIMYSMSGTCRTGIFWYKHYCFFITKQSPCCKFFPFQWEIQKLSAGGAIDEGNSTSLWRESCKTDQID